MRRRHKRRRARRGSSLFLLVILFILVIGIPALLVRSCTVSFFSIPKAPLVVIWDEQSNTLMSMTLEEYVQGVVAAEMPASFGLEALKAQAVAARTYAYRRIQRNDTIPEHPDAHLSTDYKSGQAWVSWETFFDRYGLLQGRQLQKKIKKAVNQTIGWIAVYDGEPILAVYHSTSGGRTENSEHYWSEQLPYLRGVHDPYSASSPYHFTTATFSTAQLCGSLEVSKSTDLRVVERYPSGRVKTVEVGDKWFSGREVRQRLGLRSSWFTVDLLQNDVVFSVWGFGHGVGMSQYGADGMAQQGYDYQEILQYYYQGIELKEAY